MKKMLSLWRGEILVAVPMVTMKEIAAEVCHEHGIRLSDLLGQSRERRFAWPRQEAMWRMSAQAMTNGSPRYSLPQIGAFMGGRDHSTVVHGIKAHAERNGLAYKGRSANRPRWTYEAA